MRGLRIMRSAVRERSAHPEGQPRTNHTYPFYRPRCRAHLLIAIFRNLIFIVLGERLIDLMRPRGLPDPADFAVLRLDKVGAGWSPSSPPSEPAGTFRFEVRVPSS